MFGRKEDDTEWKGKKEMNSKRNEGEKLPEIIVQRAM
jgi:hypothetical protein